MSLFTETVTLRKKTTSGTDKYGRPIPAPPEDASAPAWFEPIVSSENVAAAEQYVSGYWLFLPLGYQAALSGADAVILPGLGEFQVKGQPGVQPGGFVVEGYVRAALERVTG